MIIICTWITDKFVMLQSEPSWGVEGTFVFGDRTYIGKTSIEGACYSGDIRSSEATTASPGEEAKIAFLAPTSHCMFSAQSITVSACKRTHVRADYIWSMSKIFACSAKERSE